MDPVAIERRRAVVDAARRPPINDRTALLRDAVRGKRLLDIGVVDHSLGGERSGRWLHGQLAAEAASSLGVDILEEQVAEIRALGYQVECIDVTSGGRPAGTFDVIVAGEVIEHVGNIGGLFDAASDLLAPGGTFLLTTPNPFAAWRVYQHLRGRPHENVDHVSYFSAWGIAELADRAGLQLRSFRGIVANEQTGRKAKLMAWLMRRRLVRFVPEAMAESILYEMTISSSIAATHAAAADAP
jgi:2-polyprenyl-3-methyl-5-hydroxy-6-metoxy-1,4-benzoquinol methylase